MTVENYLDDIKGKYGEIFENFKDILLLYNNKFNLTAITDEKGIYIKHFLDSVVGERLIERGAGVVEIGSGGGFPSVPLKIIRSDLSFTLIESTGKKCTYLKEVVDKLNLDCVKVINARAEDVAREVMHREKYDICLARAVARLNTLTEYCLPFVKVGGKFIAYKGDCEEELEEALPAVTLLGGRVEKTVKYCLPDGEKRTLVVVRKIKNTPTKFPRGNGKERKDPIKKL